jgi:hypothetical protein
MRMKLKTYELHPVGRHRATIGEIFEKSTDYGPGLEFEFFTPEGRVTTLASQVYSAKSKLGQIVLAVAGKLPEEFDTDKLKGKDLVIVVVHQKKDDGTTRDNITEFLPKTASVDAGADPFADV